MSETVDLDNYLADDGKKSYVSRAGISIYSDGKISINTAFVRATGLLKFEHVNFFYRKNHSLIMIFSEKPNKTSRKLSWHRNGLLAYVNSKSLMNRFKIDPKKAAGFYQPRQAKTSTGEICFKINFAEKQRRSNYKPQSQRSLNK